MPAHRVQPPCSEEGSPWPAKVSVQCTHALQLVFSEHTLCSSLRSEHASEELRCRRWGTHRWRAARQADHACTIAKTRAATPSFCTFSNSRPKMTFSNSRPKMGRKWVKQVGVLKTDLPASWPNIWRLRPSAGRPGGRPLRFVVFHIDPLLYPNQRPRRDRHHTTAQTHNTRSCCWRRLFSGLIPT